MPTCGEADPATGTAAPRARGVADHLHERRTRNPAAVAVATWHAGGWDTMTWAALHDTAFAAAQGWHGLPAPADPAVVLLDDTPAAVAVLLGATIAGVPVIPLERGNSQLADQDSPVRRIGAAAVCPAGDMAATQANGLKAWSYTDLLTGTGGSAASSPAAPDSLLLQLTSGSTGGPRLARQTAGNALRGAHLYRTMHGIDHTDTVLATVPLAHSFGLVGALATAVLTGARLLTARRFSAAAVLAGLERGATVLLGSPLGYRLISGALGPRPRPGALRAALCSGGPLPSAVAGEARQRLGVPLHQMYGSTETGLIAGQYDRTAPWPPGSVGTPAPGVSFRLRGTDGALTERGEGTLLVDTPAMLLGYAGGSDPPAYDRGWYDTGDVARVDDEGHVFLLGRKNTFVNVGGRKVNAGWVEGVLRMFPPVRDVAVYGVLNSQEDEELWAAVTLDHGFTEADVLSFCRSRLAPHETPHQVRVLDALPRTAMGKLRRADLPGIPEERP